MSRRPDPCVHCQARHPIADRCPAMGPEGKQVRSLVITPLGWKASKYGRDPRKGGQPGADRTTKGAS